jgi:hypothetical protein
MVNGIRKRKGKIHSLNHIRHQKRANNIFSDWQDKGFIL